MRLALVLCLAFNLTWAARVSIQSVIEQDLEGDEEQHFSSEGEEELEGCNPSTCPSFDHKRCPCTKFNEAQLMPRFKEILTTTLQRMRKVTDKLDEESSSFTKFWWSSSVGKAQKDLKLLEAAIESGSFPTLKAIMNQNAVNAIEQRTYEVPASAHPISVEIWDHNSVTKNVFIGEVGVDLVDGRVPYPNKKLQRNEHQTSAFADPGEGKVSFETDVTRSGPKDCDIQGVKRCIEMTLTVTCTGASDLPNVDTGIAGNLTDAYCKVRVKKDPSMPAIKFKTPVIRNSLSPTFSHDAFVLTWDVPIIEPVPTNSKPDKHRGVPESKMVPFTSEYLTIGEQLEHQVMYLGSVVYLDKDSKCKSASVKPACDMLVKFSNVGIDEKAVADLRQAADSQSGAGHTEQQRTSGSVVQISEDMDIGLDTEMIHVRAAAISGGRRSRARRSGGGYHGGGSGGDGGCGGCWLAVFIIFIIIVCTAR